MSAEIQNPNNNLQAVYQVMVSGESMTALGNWIETYSLYHTTVRALSSPEDDFHNRECAFVIETATMKIVWKECSCQHANCDHSIVPALAELDSRLNP